MRPEKYKLAVIEDNEIILDSLVEFFGASDRFDLILMAGSSEQFMDSWKEQRIDLLLCDIGLPGKSGIEAAWFVKRRSVSTQVVMYTVFDDKEAIFQALCAGASGYLLKNTPLMQVEDRLMEVLNGGSVMSPHVARMVIGHFNPHLDKAYVTETERLTPREIEIVSMLQNGDSYKVVAEKFFISVDTVKFHIRNIYGKLQINSRAELMNKYKRPM
ncbi:response regulator [Parapedobacter indicus]|uniref:Two component transcriptional regulator, LuxR family n=1 Tax=Parapedobacter indicus TaxID=1477437 RepID=A0A1I3FK13_9SPHI|nr:response regulator transcription factor [Parapedobacter indicus]PPL03751.1 LuxR family two component transcriptional regulator [Parapedobacter indicus]SFI11251.1 two component transcriptional regulator, LuxR family [Parapedobacter indicus]